MARPEEPLAADGGSVTEFAAGLRRLRVEAGSPTYRQLSVRAHFASATLSDAARGRRLPTLAVTLAFVEACGGDRDEWETQWREVSAELSGAEPEPDPGEAPYVGLAPFEARDADRFFGRAKAVADLLERVRTTRFVGVFGASGAGKSSLLRAGLIAQLNAGDRRVILFSPGPHPVDEYATQVASLASDDTELVLVVDQFEEVFSLCEEVAEREAFISTLVRAATDTTSRTRVVIGVRADFYGHCGRYPELVEVLRDAQVLVGPMTSDELREAITQPATRAGYKIEGALLSRLVADATGQTAVLPLLSHALLETWRRRRGMTLTLTGYERTGCLRDALARSAEKTFITLNADERQAAHGLFLRLIAVDDGARRRVAIRELEDDEPTATVLARFAESRLITLDRDSVEVTHEALIQHWPRLGDWLTEDREGLRIHRQLTEATAGWEAVDRDTGALYRGVRLRTAYDWAAEHPNALSSRERKFLATSHRADQRRARRLKQVIAMLTTLLLLASVAFVYATHTQQVATEQRDIAVSRTLVDQATALQNSNPALSLQLKLAAFRLADNPTTRSALLSSFAVPYVTRLSERGEVVAAFDFSHDSHLVATLGEDKKVRVWDISEPRLPHVVTRIPFDHPVMVGVAFGHDDRTLLVGGFDNAELWSLTDPQHPVLLASRTGVSPGVDFTADGRVLLIGERDLQLWAADDLSRSTPLATIRGKFLAGSPDGRLLTTEGEHADEVLLWDISNAANPRRLADLSIPQVRVRAMAFGRDSKTLMAAAESLAPDTISPLKRTVELWELASGRYDRRTGRMSYAEQAIQHGGGSVTATAFSSGGGALAVGYRDNTVGLVDVSDLEQPQLLLELAAHPRSPHLIGFSQDDRWLASAGSDSGLALFDRAALPLAPSNRTTSFGPDGPRQLRWKPIAFQAPGKLVVGSALLRTTTLWDVADLAHPVRIGQLAEASFDPSASFQTNPAQVLDLLKKTRLWDSSEARHDLAGLLELDLPAAFSAAKRILGVASLGRDAAGIRGPEVELWDATDDQRLVKAGVLNNLPTTPSAIAFSADGGMLALLVGQGMLELWDVANPRSPDLVATLPGESRVFALNPASPSLATAGDDGKIELWSLADPRRPERSAVVNGHTGGVDALSFTADGKDLITTGQDGTIRLWSVADQRTLQPTATLTGHTRPIIDLAVSPDGHTFATVSEDHLIRVWETDPERVAARICGLTDAPISELTWNQYAGDMPYPRPCP